MSESTLLQTLSNNLSFAIEKSGVSLVRVDDGSRLTATGTIWSADGLIVTTSHGVERDEELSIELHSGATLPASILGRDPETDIAVLKVDGGELFPVELAPSSVGVGALVLAVGRPGSAGLQATFGIVSSVRTSQVGGESGRLFHTDAILYPGFSGGALVDAGGNFVGLLNLGRNRGRGLALGADVVQEVVGSILTHGHVQRSYLGIGTQPVSLATALRQRLGDKHEEGLLVISVDEGSAADKAGLLVGDTVLSVQGESVGDPYSLRRALRSHRPGTQIKVEVLRGGDLKVIEAELGARG